jgi:hypothetical protein
VDLQLFTTCLELSLQVLSLLGVEWQLLGLHDARLLLKGPSNLLEVEFLLLGIESRLLGDLKLDPDLRRRRCL